MTYKLDNIPEDLDHALRERAAAEHKTLYATVIEILSQSVGVKPTTSAEPHKYRDLSDIAGTWVSDPETEAVLEEQGSIDPEMWQ
jgi:hypothetical protein